jgi:hypothetical protein
MNPLTHFKKILILPDRSELPVFASGLNYPENLAFGPPR